MTGDNTQPDKIVGRIRLHTQPINGFYWSMFHEHPDGVYVMASYSDPIVVVIQLYDNTKTFPASTPCSDIEGWVLKETKKINLKNLLFTCTKTN